LGFDNGIDEDQGLEEASEKYFSTFGLFDFEKGIKGLEEIIHKTDIPTLDFIPETPELHLLDRTIGNKNRREFWLSDNVATPLKSHYDLIIFDCSPNWNNLVTNAIAASDLLISPIECKINNYRNYSSFEVFMETFKKETHLSFSQIFVPTRLSPTRKLSKEIRSWYLANVPNCISSAIREGVKGEEAMASYVSLPEYAPTSLDAQEMRQVIQEIWVGVEEALKTKSNVFPQSVIKSSIGMATI
jgi:chromosome partitioning protein